MSSSQQIGLLGDFTNVPYIPANLTLNQISQLFPKGFEDILEYNVDPLSNTVNIDILTDDNRLNTIITLSENLFNPAKNNCNFPRFLIEQSHKYPKIDYLTDTRNRFIFNQNELFYILIQHRLCEFKKYKKAYANLVNSDIRSVMDFISYIPCNAYNAKQKVNNSYIVLSIFDQKTKSLKRVMNGQCLGNILKVGEYHPNKKTLELLLQTLPLHFSSESMGEHSKFVLHSYETALYRSVGYRLSVDTNLNPIAQSLFPPKQNNAARFKTHVTADAYPITKFKPTSLFIQDYLPNIDLNIFEPKDQCYRETLVVIHPILDNNKFLFGEVEASPEFVKTQVYVRESVSEQFDHIAFEMNFYKKANSDGKVFVGTTIENEEVFIENCIGAKLTQDIILGTLGARKLVFEVTRHCGNARIDSNTGLKGVTTCRPKRGKIHIPSLNQELEPDLVFGMNSFKAKGNGIELARAALAVKLKTYTPKHPTGLLNTWDEDEINRASKSLPEYYYEDMFGNRQTVQIGIVYTRITELCYIFKSYRKQTFSFEFGRVLHDSPNKALFENIWKNYVDQDTKEATIELEKILLDKKDIFEDKLPIYTPMHITSKKIFTQKDLISNVLLSTQSDSKLLDEDWNKGFFIDFTPIGGKVVRFPSAKMLNMFCTETESKMHMYSSMIVLISKIISIILSNQLQLLFPRTNSNYARNQTPIINYYKMVKGTLYSDEDSAVMLVQSLSRPEIPGIAMKQVTDYILPDNVAVVMCRKTYNRAINDALGEDHPLISLQHNFWGMHGRAPFLWRSQGCPLQIWNSDDFEIYLSHKFGISLKDYIHPHLNNDVLIFSNNIFAKSQSDQDGDHSAVFIPAGLEAQDSIKNYHDPNITEAERLWIAEYLDGERESNDDLIDKTTGQLINHTYKLYQVPLHDIKISRNQTVLGFSTYLRRAIVAKGNIGVATNDGWIFNMLLDLYSVYAIKNNHKYQPTDKSQVKAMMKLPQDHRNELSCAYTIALQKFVVRGVKHTANGSEDFEILFLDNFHQTSNSDSVFKLLTHDLKLSPTLASKMIFIVTWAEAMGFLKACGAFLKLYNKGTIPTREEVVEALALNEEFIQLNTYFGMLLEPIYNLRKYSKEYETIKNAQVQKFVEPQVVDMSNLLYLN